MAALTADRKTTRKEGIIGHHAVKAATTIYQGSLVCIDASGWAVPASDTPGLIFVGVAVSRADNASGANGDIDVQVYRKGLYSFAASGLTRANEGDAVYVTDDQTVQTSSANVTCGVLVQYVSATEAYIDIEPAIEQGDTAVKTFVISAFWPSTVGAVKVNAMENLEMPLAFTVLRAYAKCQTAPGGAYVCTIEMDDGSNQATVTITGAATTGEDEAINQAFAADADLDITLIDDNALAATADVQVYFVCQWA